LDGGRYRIISASSGFQMKVISDMARTVKRYTKVITAGTAVLVIFVMLLMYCVVPSDAPEKKFHFVHSGSPDFVAPYGTMDVIFSEELSDSSDADFEFNPPFYAYSIEYSSERDTVLLRFSEPLRGAVTYSIRLKKTVHSVNASVFSPDDDSLVITTEDREQEPNDHLTVADTLRSRCFGAVAMVNDTDWYIVPLEVRKVYCNSFGSRTGFFIKGLNDNGIPRMYTQFDTVTIPDTVTPPLYLAIHSYLRSVGGYYETGCLPTGD